MFNAFKITSFHAHDTRQLPLVAAVLLLWQLWRRLWHGILRMGIVGNWMLGLLLLNRRLRYLVLRRLRLVIRRTDSRHRTAGSIITAAARRSTLSATLRLEQMCTAFQHTEKRCQRLGVHTLGRHRAATVGGARLHVRVRRRLQWRRWKRRHPVQVLQVGGHGLTGSQRGWWRWAAVVGDKRAQVNDVAHARGPGRRGDQVRSGQVRNWRGRIRCA